MKPGTKTTKVLMLTIFSFGALLSGLPAQADELSECNVYKASGNPKGAYLECVAYCNLLRCDDSFLKGSKLCGGALQLFQKLGVGDPICISPKRAYVTNFNQGTTSVCTINRLGNFENCVDSGVNNLFSEPVSIVLNSLENTAYITNYSANTVSKCLIGVSGLFSSCLDSGATNLNLPFGIALNKAENTVFVSNNNPGPPNVNACTVSGGSFSNCVDSGAAISAGRPSGVTLKGTNIAYVPDDTGSGVMKCSVSAGALTGCVNTGSFTLPLTGFTNPILIALNPSETIAYITDHTTNSVVRCDINSTADLANCKDSGAGAIFPFAFGIKVNEAGDAAYVVSYSGQNVTKCKIDTNSGSVTYGSFVQCVDSGVGATFFGPTGIELSY